MRNESALLTTLMAAFLAIGLSAPISARADCMRALPGSSELICSPESVLQLPERRFEGPREPGLSWSIELTYEQEELPEANGLFLAPLVRRRPAFMPMPDATVHGIPIGPPPQVKAGVRFTYRWSGSVPWR